MQGFRRALVHYSMRKKKVKPTRAIVLSFVVIILVGTILLMLPISSRDGEITPPLDALFTATSATCVTGLIVYDTYSHWSVFGQGVLLALIQIGGLGFMAVVSVFFFLFNRRIGLRERLLLMQSMNLNEVEGVVSLIRKVLFGTLLFEGCGAVILSACFIPRFGWAGGIWRGIFHSISAFCNAGFDLLGKIEPYSSLTSYAGNPVVLLTISALIIVGGIGFFVWGDIYRQRSFKRLSVYSKLVLIITALLLLSGWVLFLVLEWNNPKTLGNLSFFEKLLNGFFQSVTTRTAGFNAIDQGALTDASKVLSSVLMLIGGSGGSTAGGIKTVTLGVIVLATLSTLRGKRELVIFKRRIDWRQISSATALLVTALVLTLSAAIVLSVLDHVDFLDGFYEVASAYGTVGLTTGITTSLSVVSRLILIVFMFFGRVGLMTFSIAFMYKRRDDLPMRYPLDSLIIG